MSTMTFVKDFNHRNFDSVSGRLKFRKYLYFRQIIRSAKWLSGEKSVLQNIRSAKCAFDEMSVGKMSVALRLGLFG
jgi:hypothetical protein